MQELLKTAVQDTWMHALVQRFRHWRAFGRWMAGAPLSTPPEIYKQRVVKRYAAEFGLEILIETGTYFGDMVGGCRRCFGRIFSIELDALLFHRARAKFAKYGHIRIIPGDSGQVLTELLKSVDGPCLFWLDAHAMGGSRPGVALTPVLDELRQILASDVERYVLLIDDARLFGRGGYPGLDTIKRLVLTRHPDWVFSVADDIVRIHPASPMSRV